jgi:hypothetical protein
LGDPGLLQSIRIDSGRPEGMATVLSGADAREQLVVTGQYDSGQERDLTSEVTYASEPSGVVSIDSTGLVTPLADGQTTITAALGELQGSFHVEVAHLAEEIPVNFPNQITPIFTKLGCNGGGCHGKASGQNGFKLSLLGFVPHEDYEFLVKEARGRRLFPAAPDRSLLLTKAANLVPHGGGQRLEVGSHEYRLLRRWIAQGMPYGKDTDPKVERIEIFPSQRIMPQHGQQQLTVIAHYTDGSSDDVTRMTTCEANDTEMAEVSETGLVQTLDLAGSVAVMARYQGHVSVFRASIPLGVEMQGMPEPRGFVDENVLAKLNELGVPPSEACDDSTFLRRSAIDIAGRLPTPEEVQAFMADTDPARRDKWIDRLLDDPGYADYFANKWSAILRNKRVNNDYARGNLAFHDWIRTSLYMNMPYDQFVTQIVAASGDIGTHPPVVWYREVKDSNQLTEDTAQLFLGLRIQCARCHHHPFEKWSQHDYYGFTAFFSRTGRKNRAPSEQAVYHNRGLATAKDPNTGETIKPTGLGQDALDILPDEDPRQRLADWMTDPANPFFARSLVNRYWKHFFDRGLVDPEDDMRVTNPASNPELLDALAQHFIDSGFDLKDLVRTICQSRVYQFSSLPNEYNVNDKQNYSRYYPKRLTAEVLLDSINLVTDTTTSFGGMPVGTRAVQLPDQDNSTYFLTVFGKPQSDSACECERSQEANLAQSLHLLNSSEIQGKLTDKTGRAAKLADDKDRSHEDKIRELYLWVYSRAPSDDELKIALAHIEKSENPQPAYEDIVWALINTKEFLFNH